MTRRKFVIDYAERSGLDAKWAGLGFIEVGDKVLLALPCGCDDEMCEGWAMVGAQSALDHLFLYAPDELRDAYRAAIDAAGGA